MIIGYRRPGFSYEFVGVLEEQTPDFITSTEELADGNPQSVTRISTVPGYPVSPNDPFPFLGGAVRLRVEFDERRKHRLFGLQGVALPRNAAGELPESLAVEIAYRRAVDVTYEYQPAGLSAFIQPLIPNDEGKAEAWWLLPDTMDVVAGVEIRFWFYEYVSPSADPTDGPPLETTDESVIDIGEIWASPVLELPIEQKFSYQYIDPTIRRRALDSSLDRVERTPYRQLDVRLPTNTTEVERRGGLTDNMDWRQLERELLRAKTCVVAFQHKTGGVFDQTELNLNVMMAECEPGPTSHVDKTYYTKSLRFSELPS